MHINVAFCGVYVAFDARPHIFVLQEAQSASKQGSLVLPEGAREGAQKRPARKEPPSNEEKRDRACEVRDRALRSSPLRALRSSPLRYI